MAQPTHWEEQQIDSIHLLLEQADGVMKYFQRKEEKLSSKEESRNIDEEQLQFRLIVFNLYSVLDYIYYLLYCHYSNQGQPDLSSRKTQCGFPYKAKGVRVSDTKQDQSEQFTEEKLTFLWGSKIGKKTHMWKEIGDILLSVQPKLKVNGKGESLSEYPMFGYGNEESLALLHFYRNCCAHRGLITFEAKDMIFEIDQSTRAFSVVPVKTEKEGVFCFDIPKTAFWIQLPDHVIGHRPPKEQVPRMLLDVLEQLFNFTRSVCRKLLLSAMILPKATQVMNNYLPESHAKLDRPVECKPIDGKQHVTVTICLSDCQELLSKTSSHQDKGKAEEEAFASLLSTLAKKRLYPSRPYTYFYSIPCQLNPSPPIIKLVDKNNKQILNEYKQKLSNLGLQFSTSEEGPTGVPDQQGFFELKKMVEVLDSEGMCLLHIESGQCVCKGKDKTSEEAVRVIVSELAHLGFIQIVKQ